MQRLDHLVNTHRWDLLNNLNPSKYTFATYQEQMDQLFKHLKLDDKQVSWIGTSMGGILGVLMASQPNTPIKRLVLNDIGPEVPFEGLCTLAQMMPSEKLQSFTTLEEATHNLKTRYKDSGLQNQEDWDAFTKASIRHNPTDQRYHLDFDPAIVASLQQFNQMRQGLPPALQKSLIAPSTTMMFNFWHVWKQAGGIPTLIFRGETSTILSREILSKMLNTNPQAHAIEIPATGHAPTLLPQNQLQHISDWLETKSGQQHSKE